MEPATFSASAGDANPPVEPGSKGKPARWMAWRARVFEPTSSIDSGVGPINTIPLSRQARANAARSDKKPYPGWIASAPQRLATSMIFEMFRYDSEAGAGPIG